jgi:hypothetical protein
MRKENIINKLLLIIMENILDQQINKAFTKVEKYIIELALLDDGEFEGKELKTKEQKEVANRMGFCMNCLRGGKEYIELLYFFKKEFAIRHAIKELDKKEALESLKR